MAHTAYGTQSAGDQGSSVASMWNSGHPASWVGYQQGQMHTPGFVQSTNNIGIDPGIQGRRYSPAVFGYEGSNVGLDPIAGYGDSNGYGSSNMTNPNSSIQNWEAKDGFANLNTATQPLRSADRSDAERSAVQERWEKLDEFSSKRVAKLLGVQEKAYTANVARFFHALFNALDSSKEQFEIDYASIDPISFCGSDGRPIDSSVATEAKNIAVIRCRKCDGTKRRYKKGESAVCQRILVRESTSTGVLEPIASFMTCKICYSRERRYRSRRTREDRTLN